jgi:hypothetical protein
VRYESAAYLRDGGRTPLHGERRAGYREPGRGWGGGRTQAAPRPRPASRHRAACERCAQALAKAKR